MPFRIKRLFTAGHAAVALGTCVVVYFVWGRFFVPGGTGSNVVLGLLVALAAIYVGATNLGPLVDDLLTRKEAREGRRLRRVANELAHDVETALAADVKAKPARKIDAGLRAEVEATREQLITALRADDDAEIEARLKALDGLVERAFHAHKPGALHQMRSLGVAFAVAVALRLFLVAPFQIPSGSMIPTLLIGDHLFVFRAMYGLQSPVGEEPSYLVRWSIPKPGDVVVFEAPPWVPVNAGEDWIKRVIAGPGQTVKRVDTTIFVDGKPYTEIGDGMMTRYMDFEEGPGGGGRWHQRIASHRREDINGRVHDVFVDMPPQTTDWPGGIYPRGDHQGLTCTRDACTVQDGYVFVMGDNRDHSSDGRVWGAVPIDNVKGKALFIWVSVDGSRNSVSLGRFTLPAFRWGRLFDWID